MSPLKDRFMRAFHFLLIGAIASHAAADSDKRVLFPTHVNAAYKQECASCHVAYPPALLPAMSWQKIMGELSAHYGSNASLEDSQIQEIGQWLKTYAGTYKKVQSAPPENRITRSDWFVREHRQTGLSDRSLPGHINLAQCTLCHTKADQGRYGEGELARPSSKLLQTPKALTP